MPAARELFPDRRSSPPCGKDSFLYEAAPYQSVFTTSQLSNPRSDRLL